MCTMSAAERTNEFSRSNSSGVISPATRRHLSFARHFMHRTVPELGFLRRLHLALLAPVVLGIMARLMLRPSGDLARHCGVPAGVVRAANRSPQGRQLLKDSVAKTRKLFRELGLVTPASKALWKTAGLWDEHEQ